MNFNKILLLGSLLFLVTACNDDMTTAPVGDYRDGWVGTYVGTKSNRSLDDDMFTTPIEFEAVKDTASTDGMNINGILFPMSEDGEYGPDFLDDDIFNYTVIIQDSDITMEIFGSIPNGIIAPCYIKATKQ